MALQGSGTISIDNIRTELGQAQANSSLRSLSALAGKSSPDAMSEFYGYSAATEYSISRDGYGDPTVACGEGYSSGQTSVYSADSSLRLNSELFSDETLTAAFDGQDLWYYTSGGVFQVNSSGRIFESYNC